MPSLIPIVPYLVLLALAPLIGNRVLKFVYPDIRIFLPSRRWAISIAFGLASYVPAAYLGMYELLAPFYAPGFILFEWEQNALVFLLSYIGFLVVISSIIEYRRSHKKSMVVLPKDVIRFSIQQQRKKVRKAADALYQRRERDIEAITRILEKAAGPKAGVAAPAVSEEAAQIELPAEKEAPPTKEELTEGLEKILDKRAEKGRRITEELEKAAKETREERKADRVGSIMSQLKDSLKMEKMAKQIQRDKILSAIEQEIAERKAKAEKAPPSDKEQKVDRLLEVLRYKLERQKALEKSMDKAGKVEEEITKDDIEGITKALRELRKKEGKGPEMPFEEEEVERGGRRGRRRRGVVSKDRTEREVLKTVVGDVRDQLISEKQKEEAEKIEPGERWYQKTPKAAPEARPEFPGLGETEMGIGGLEAGEVELFEDALDFGGLEGAELGEDLLGEVGEELGELDQELGGEEGYDGMFVDLKVKNVCPTCGKKGTTVVYCSSCGKPFCSNCAKDIKSEKDLIYYTCPNCKEVTVVKRR